MATAVSDDLDQFVANYRAKGVPKSSGDDELDQFVKSYSEEKSAPPDTRSPFGTLAERSARLGEPMIPLAPPKNLFVDTTKIPRNPFTNELELAPPIATEEEKQRAGTIGPRPNTEIPMPFGAAPAQVPDITGALPRAIAAGAYPGSFAEELKRRAGVTDAELQREQAGGLRLFDPAELMTESQQHEHPIATGALQAIGGLTTPENIGITAATAGIGEAPAAVRAGLSTLFAMQMAKGAYDAIPGIRDAWNRGDYAEVKRLATLAGVNTALAGAAAGHGVNEFREAAYGEPAPLTLPPGTVSAPLKVDEALGRGARRMQEFEANNAAREGMANLANAESAIERARQERINAPVAMPRTFNPDEYPRLLPGPIQGPETNPLEREATQVLEQRKPTGPQVVDRRRVGAGENLAPESPATLRKQVDMLAEGTNKVVYFPKGTENLPAPPDNAVVTNVPGDKPGSGIYYHDPSIKSEDIYSAVDNGTYGKLLGNVQTKQEAEKGNPGVLVSRDANGTEQKASVVDLRRKAIVRLQEKELNRQFPNGQVSVETPEKVISERQKEPAQPLPAKFRTDKAANIAAAQPTKEQMIDAFRTDKGRLETERRSASPEEQSLIDDRLATINQHLEELTGQKPLQKFVDRPGTDIDKFVEQYGKPSSSEQAEKAAVSPGDYVEASNGALAGKTLEVTKAGKSGIYVREGDGPIKFVKNGEYRRLEAAKEVKDLIGAGKRYSGADPRILKNLIPEPLREKLAEENRYVALSRNVQGGMYDLESQAAADMLRAREILKNAPGSPKDLETIYHSLEDSSIKLTPEQAKIREQYVKPLMDASREAYEKITGNKVAEGDEHVHRIAAERGGILDRILGGKGKLNAGNPLSKSAPGAKRRTMMALEDENGNRRVVSIKDNHVTAWEQGRPADMGRFRTPAQKGVDEYYDEKVMSGLEKLASDLGISHERTAKKLGGEEKIPGTFVDKSGKRWNVKQATTKEIEANTNIRYYKNALASAVLDFLQMRRAERAYDYLEGFKNSPEFGEIAHKIGSGNAPEGWRPTMLPQFHGYLFEPHTAEVLDWFAKRMNGGDAGVIDRAMQGINHFLRTAAFFNPLIHTPNIGVHWAVEKGVTGFGPKNWGTILRTGSRAIDAVIHQNQDFLDALDSGAPLQSQRLDNDVVNKLIIQRMGKELESNPGYAAKIAGALGYANPLKLVRAIYDFSNKATWMTNDIALLQATYEHMERTGQPFKEAVADVAKHIPDYRLPTRIFDSKALGTLMSNPNLTMFGAYHYGALRSYGEMIKEMAAENVPPAQRLKSLDRMAMLGLVTFAAYPAMDQLAKLVTGDKTAQLRRAGASTFIYNLAQLLKGDKTPTEALQAVATPAAGTKSAVELAFNKDLRTGRDIYDSSAPARTIAKQVGRYALKSVNPVGMGMDLESGKKTLKQLGAGLFGVKTNVQTPAEALASRLLAKSMGTAAPDEDTLERATMRRTYEQRLRDKEITPADVAKDRASGKLNAHDQEIILRNAARTPLQNAMRNLGPEEALKVWNKATPEEQQQIRTLFAGKLSSMGKVPPERREQVRQQILLALHPHTPAAGGLPRVFSGI